MGIDTLEHTARVEECDAELLSGVAEHAQVPHPFRNLRRAYHDQVFVRQVPPRRSSKEHRRRIRKRTQLIRGDTGAFAHPGISAAPTGGRLQTPERVRNGWQLVDEPDRCVEGRHRLG